MSCLVEEGSACCVHALKSIPPLSLSLCLTSLEHFDFVGAFKVRDNIVYALLMLRLVCDASAEACVLAQTTPNFLRVFVVQHPAPPLSGLIEVQPCAS